MALRRQRNGLLFDLEICFKWFLSSKNALINQRVCCVKKISEILNTTSFLFKNSYLSKTTLIIRIVTILPLRFINPKNSCVNSENWETRMI